MPTICNCDDSEYLQTTDILEVDIKNMKDALFFEDKTMLAEAIRDAYVHLFSFSAFHDICIELDVKTKYTKSAE